MHHLLACLPVLVFWACVIGTAALAGRRLRRRLPRTGTLLVGAVGLALAVGSRPVTLLVSVLASSYLAGAPRWKEVGFPPDLGLHYLAGALFVAALVSAAVTRARAGPRGEEGATAGADPAEGRARRAWPPLLGAAVVLAGLAGISDWMEGVYEQEERALQEGRSFVLWRRQAVPLAVPSLAGVKVGRMAIESGAGHLVAAGVDGDGHVHRWSPETFAWVRLSPEPDGPARAGGMAGGVLCGVRGEGRAACWLLLHGEPVARDFWPEAAVTAVDASSECGRSRVCAVSEGGAGACFTLDAAGRARPEAGTARRGVRLLVPGFVCGECAALLEGGARCEADVVGTAISGVVKGLGQVTAMSVSASRGCAIEEGGALRCWENERPTSDGPDRAGDPVADWPSRWEARPYLGGTRVDEVAVNDGHVCARSGLKAYCWGDNSWGQLCDGTSSASTTPREVVGAPDVTGIAVSWGTTCLAHAGGGVSCCGRQARR